jgi:multiple sugar transport system substrate-binding protein
MKKLFKLLIACVLALAFAVSAAGCGEIKRGGEITRDEYDVNLTLPASYQGEIKVLRPDNEVEEKILNALIKGFNEKYPLIKVTTNLLSMDSYNATVMRQFEAEVLADILWTDSAKYYFLVANGIALNLDAYLDAAKAQGVFDYEQDFTDEAKKMGKYGEYLFAVPRTCDSVITFYNKEILGAAGVDMSVLKNGWTWDEFLGVCQKVRDYYDAQGKNNYYPIDANLNWESVGYPIIKSLGGEVISSDGKFALTAEVNQKVSEFIKVLVDRRFVASKNDSVSSFEGGSGALLFQSATIDKFENLAVTRGKFDVCSFPLINGENSAIGHGFAGYAVNRKLKDEPKKLEAALAFMAYLMSEDGQQIIAKEGGLTLPSIRSGLSQENPDAIWHKEYTEKGFNVAAYAYGSQYKTDLDFIGYIDPIFASDVVSAIRTYVGSYAVKETPANALKYFKADIDDAFNSVVE